MNQFETSLNLKLPSPIQQIKSELFTQKSIELYVKRDDLIHPYLSGNKWRKLKYNLLEAQQQNQHTLLTFGGAYSNHIHATAAAGKLFGFNTIGIIRGEAHEELNPTLAFARQQGMRLEYIDRQNYRRKTEAEFVQSLRKTYGDFYLIPEGGSNREALPGCAEVVTEIQQQLGNKVDYICTAVGSGGTLAGMASQNANIKLMGFAVLKNAVFLNDDVTALLKNRHASQWDILLDFHFGGYAKRNDELMSFLHMFSQRFKIPIEPIYTAKMFYGLFQLIEQDYFPVNSRIVALHTGGLQGFNDEF